MKGVFTATAAALLATTAMAERADAQQAFPMVYVRVLQNDVRGQGMTRLHGNECYVIIPDHLIKPDRSGGPSAPEIEVTVDEVRVRVDNIAYEPPFAILRTVRDTVNQPACAPRASVSAAEETIRGLRLAVRGGRVTMRGSDGRLSHRPIRVYRSSEDTDRLTIETNQEFPTGTSGGLVYVDIDPTRQVLVGMVEDTRTSGLDSDGVQQAEVYTLPYLERQVGNHLRFLHRPPPMAIFGSVPVPGVGQWVTRGWKGGIVGTGLPLAAVVGLSHIRKSRIEMRPFVGEDGVTRHSPYRIREYQFREPRLLAAVWLAAGVVSTLEARSYVNRNYSRPNTARTGVPDAAVRVRPAGVEGGMGTALSLEFTF